MYVHMYEKVPYDDGCKLLVERKDVRNYNLGDFVYYTKGIFT